MNSVVDNHGKDFVKLIVKYCTDGNVAPFGIESFDDEVRSKTHIYGKADKIIKAIETINEFGADVGPNGFPKFLPGVNLMHGLPGQTLETHSINMSYLNKIYEQGLQTHRLFYRYMTPAEGVIVNNADKNLMYYNTCKKEIMDNFVMPMQQRVYSNALSAK
jgi:radical SAM superfamily enzyme with C-terminal helix-hairpin-helix motif